MVGIAALKRMFSSAGWVFAIEKRREEKMALVGATAEPAFASQPPDEKGVLTTTSVSVSRKWNENDANAMNVSRPSLASAYPNASGIDFGVWMGSATTAGATPTRQIRVFLKL
ncbi:hypothetical protein ACLOJK_040654 [Asimina triloba]